MGDDVPSQLIGHPRHIQHSQEVLQINEMRCVFQSTQTYQVGSMHLHPQIRIEQEF